MTAYAARWVRHVLVLGGFLVAAVLLFSSACVCPWPRAKPATDELPELSKWRQPHVEHPAPLLGLVFWPVTGRFGAIVAYNLAETLALASSAWVAYLAFGRYLRTTLAAALGGLLFGFSPYMISHSLGHPPLTFVFTVPLMLLVFDDVLVRQLRPAPIAGGLLAHIVRLFAKEGRAGRFHFLHPIAPDRSASLYPDLAA